MIKTARKNMSFNIGKYTLMHGLMLAPMAGVTDSTFRLLCKSMGAEYTVSEMVCAKAMCYEKRSKKKSTESATASLAYIAEEQMPMAVQIFGSEPSFMAECASMIENMSYVGCKSKTAPAAIDINMGCPVRKITANGEGSALMRDMQLAHKIVSEVFRAVSIPVTVKIRAGWDNASVNAPEFAKAMEDAGAACICVHARTKEQLYSPGIDLTVIEKTKRAVNIPVIGNGDIYSADDAVKMMRKSGCDGVMVGRGAEGNPWIFAEISARLEGREYIPPTPKERLLTALAQLEATVADKGERIGFAESKKHMAWYIAGLKGSAAARSQIMSACTCEEIRIIFDNLLKEQ